MRIGWWVAASLILNAVWIGVVQADLLYLSLPVIVLLLIVLCRVFVIMGGTPPKNKIEVVVAEGAIGLYLGWIIIATVANATAILVAAGFDGLGIAPEFWSTLVLGVAAVVGIALAFWGGGRIAPMLSLCWGIAWVAVARVTDEPYSPTTAIAAIIAVVLIVGATVFARVRHDRTRRA